MYGYGCKHKREREREGEGEREREREREKHAILMMWCAGGLTNWYSLQFPKSHIFFSQFTSTTMIVVAKMQLIAAPYSSVKHSEMDMSWVCFNLCCLVYITHCSTPNCSLWHSMWIKKSNLVLMLTIEQPTTVWVVYCGLRHSYNLLTFIAFSQMFLSEVQSTVSPYTVNCNFFSWLKCVAQTLTVCLSTPLNNTIGYSPRYEIC